MYWNHVMPDIVEVNSIVMEASSPEDKKYARSMSKDDIHQVNGAAVQRLYQTTLDRKNIDFGDIPESKGDINKVKYMASTMESLSVLDELFSMNNIPKDDLVVINKAIANVRDRQYSFTYGYKASLEFSMLLYNTVVMAIIDATSMVIASYMDYIVGPSQTKYTQNVKFDKSRGWVAHNNLKLFNTACANGSVDNALRYAEKDTEDNFAGTGVVLIAASVVIALSTVVPITRQLIYWYYKNRSSLSEYLAVQADFLEMHRLAVQNSKAHSSSEKREIIKKQERVILKLRRASDQLAIKNENSEDFMRKELKKDSSLFSLKEMESSLAKQKMDGVGFQII